MITEPLKYQSQILDLAFRYIDEYYLSESRTKLKERMIGLQKAYNLKFDEEDFNIQVPLILFRPLVKKTSSIIHSTFKMNPLFVLEATGYTSKDQAYAMEEVLNANLKVSNFRQTAFNPLQYDLSLYGAGVTQVCWDNKQVRIPKTVNQDGFINRIYDKSTHNYAKTKRIHPLDYFRANTEVTPLPFEGWVERKNAYDFIKEVKANPDLYIMENVKASMNDFTNGNSCLSPYYHLVDTDLAEYNKDYYHKFGFLDVYKFYIYADFKGNENDLTCYYGEMLPNNKLIRFHENPHDEYKTMIQTHVYDKKENTWWGNSVAEPTLLHEKYYRLLSNIETRQAIREVEPYMFYDSDTISREQLNNHLIGIPMQSNPNKTIDSFIKITPTQTGVNQRTQQLKSELLNNYQKFDFTPQLSGTPSQGGINNRSSAAAQIVAQSSDYEANDVLERISECLCNIGQDMITILKKRLYFSFTINHSKTSEPLEMTKAQILGDYFATCKTAPTHTRDLQIQKGQNALNWLMSLMASQHPDVAQANIYPMVKDILRKLDVGDVNEILPNPDQQKQQQMLQQQQLSGQEMSPAGMQINEQMQRFNQ